MRPQQIRQGLVFVVGTTLAAGVAVVLRTHPPTREVLVPRAGDLDLYLGAAACCECHREIFNRQSQSRMAGALDTGANYYKRHEMPVPAQVNDEANGLRYRVEAWRGELFLEVARGDETIRTAMDYALGSGERGLTFVRDLDGDHYQELRMSYYADTNTWDLTPGQESDQPASLADALGRTVPKRSHGACLSCHASRLVQSGGKIDPARARFGVDCERCHGPGRDHVETAASGRAPAKMRTPALSQALALSSRLREGRPAESPQDQLLQFVASANDDRLIRDLYVCGDCHGRHEVGIPADDEHLSRFQVPALLASRCYQSSADRLRCTDCHDPHGDAVHGDERPYVAVCLRCHSSELAGSADETASRLPPAKSCPKNPRDGCIGCHMPSRSPMYRTRFTHHRIGIYQDVAASAEKNHESSRLSE